MILTNEDKIKYQKRCCDIDKYGDFIESVQGELVRAGSIFRSRHELENATLGELNITFTLNNLRLKYFETSEDPSNIKIKRGAFND